MHSHGQVVLERIRRESGLERRYRSISVLKHPVCCVGTRAAPGYYQVFSNDLSFPPKDSRIRAEKPGFSRQLRGSPSALPEVGVWVVCFWLQGSRVRVGAKWKVCCCGRFAVGMESKKCDRGSKNKKNRRSFSRCSLSIGAEIKIVMK